MKARPLRFHLALLALGLLIPLVLFAAGVVDRFTTSQRGAREQGMRETARALALAVDRELGQSIRALEVLSHSELLARELRPDVVLLDIGLPGLDGYGVARALRATEDGRGLLLIALTGYGLQEDRARALQAGFDEHLVKPVDIVRLREVLAMREQQVGTTS